MSQFITETAGNIYKGGCHCGAISFEAIGPMREIIVCHCTDCLKLAGYSWAATTVSESRFSFVTGADTVDWYQSSDFAERGFCKSCHAQLFYRQNDKDTISISPGMLDNFDGLYTSGQIYRSSLPDACSMPDDIKNLDDNWG